MLAKGVDFHGNNPFDDTAEGGFLDGTTLLTSSNRDCGSGNGNGNNRNRFPSNFQCNPSSIDGLSITNSSQGGGGIFVHAWAHNLQVANNRIYNNQGTLAGGIAIGQGEFPPQQIVGAEVLLAPGSCQSSNVTGLQLPYCHNLNVNVHHNAVTANSSEGDELFAATPSGAGGVAFCSGADNYKFNYNWVCGNLSTGDGAGVSQLGFVWDASIQHNTILFNQATNPTTPSNGGGLLIMSAPDTDPTCPGEPDADCSHAFGTVGDGIGRNLVINANLIMGNAAEAGAGGGVRFQGVNGLEVSTFPNNPERWYSVNFTNNIVTNNVAGWDGGGVSLQDSLVVNLINNTIVSNDSTASSGTLFGAFFASQASAPTPCPRDAQGANIPCVPLSDPQPAGLSSAGHTAEFLASLPTSIRCPVGHGLGGTSSDGRTNGACRSVSFPILYNDVFWENRAFNIVVTQPTATSGVQQATVELVPALNQTNTGDCIAPTNALSYWDLGLRGDHGPTDHSSGFTFSPQASVLTSTAGYPGGGTGFRGNTTTTGLAVSPVAKQYCNGSKRPPEAGGGWYQVPPGTNESNVPIPVFNLTAGATVDEGNNWVNISWGPLSLTSPATNNVLGDYSLASGSPAINYITSANSSTTYSAAPANDFFENPRKSNNAVDAGAVEFALAANTPVLNVTGGPVSFGSVATGTTSASQTLTLHNTGTGTATGITVAVATTSTPTTPNQFARAGGSCGATLAANATCTITVTFSPTTVGAKTGTATITANVAVSGSPVGLSGTGISAVLSATLTPTSWSPSQTRNCPGTTLAQRIACGLDPAQLFTLTNTGNVTLTGIAQGVLGGASPADYTIRPALSTCGPAGGGQIIGTTSLAPGASCVVTVQFQPRTSDPANSVRGATVSVTDAAGTQT